MTQYYTHIATNHGANTLPNVRPTGINKKKPEKTACNRMQQRTKKHHTPTDHRSILVEQQRENTSLILRRGRKIQAPQRPARLRIKTTLFNIHKPYRAKNARLAI
jgi:hypothetical protein